MLPKNSRSLTLVFSLMLSPLVLCQRHYLDFWINFDIANVARATFNLEEKMMPLTKQL